MRDRVSTGDEWPVGTAVFHSTLRSGPNSVGNPALLDTPVPFGPRNLDQSGSAGAPSGRAADTVRSSPNTKRDAVGRGVICGRSAFGRGARAASSAGEGAFHRGAVDMTGVV